jgi:acetyltransferase-like isoleucine patch superfamily enzyme
MPDVRTSRMIDRLRTTYQLRRCAAVGRGVRVVGRLWIHGAGRVIVGNRVTFDAAVAPIELFPWKGAVIIIGDDSVLEGGTSIECTQSITFGAGTHIGSFSRVMDNHFHPLVGDRHIRPTPRPVVFEDDVRIGPRCVVMAGARLPRGARFDAASVIRRTATVAALVV